MDKKINEDNIPLSCPSCLYLFYLCFLFVLQFAFPSVMEADQCDYVQLTESICKDQTSLVRRLALVVVVMNWCCWWGFEMIANWVGDYPDLKGCW